MIEKSKQVPCWILESCGTAHGPDTRNQRNCVVRDEVFGETFALQKSAERRLVCIIASSHEYVGASMKAANLEEEAPEGDVKDSLWLSENSRKAASSDKGQTALSASNAHAHFGWMHLDAEFSEEAAQEGIGLVVVNDETAIYLQWFLAIPGQGVGMGVATKTVVGFKEGHLVGPGKKVCSGEP